MLRNNPLRDVTMTEECRPLLGNTRPNKDCHFVFLLALAALVVFSLSWSVINNTEIIIIILIFRYCYFVDQRQTIIKLFLPIFLWFSSFILVVFICKVRNRVFTMKSILMHILGTEDCR